MTGGLSYIYAKGNEDAAHAAKDAVSQSTACTIWTSMYRFFIHILWKSIHLSRLCGRNGGKKEVDNKLYAIMPQFDEK